MGLDLFWKTTESVTKCLRLEGTSGSIIGSHTEEQQGLIVNSVGEALAISPQHPRPKPSGSSKLLQMSGQAGRWVPLSHRAGGHPLCYHSPLLPSAPTRLTVNQLRWYTWKHLQLLLLSFEGSEPVLWLQAFRRSRSLPPGARSY